MTDEEIQGVSKNVFKTYIKKKVEINHLQFLNTQKKKHSKSEHLNCIQLKVAEYLKDSRFNTREKQLLFKLRSRTLDVKQNLKTNTRPHGVCHVGCFRKHRVISYNALLVSKKLTLP